MDYRSIYDKLMLRAKSRTLIDGYKEIHHIIPKSMGGTNSQENLVALTAREHFIAHVLLAKLYGGNMWFAVLAMAGKANRKEIYAKGRMYEVAKKENAKVRSIAMIGTKVSLESKEKIKHALAKNKNASGFRSEETRANISKSLIGRKLSTTHAEKVRLNAIGNKSRTGQLHSDETRMKMSFAHIGQLKTIGMTGKKHSEETKQKMKDAVINSKSYVERCKKLKMVNDKRFFESRCVKLNALINSVFA